MEPQRLDNFLAWEPNYPEAVIGSGLLYPQNKAIIYGREKSFKSMAALDLSMALTTSRPWHGFEVKGEHTVLYLQMEIPHPLLHKRLVKMHEAWGDLYVGSQRMREHLYVWTEPFLKLDVPAGIAVLVKALKELKPTVVILDPLYKVLTGNILDPNSARAFTDSLDLLINQYQFSLILIHHTRQSTADEQTNGAAEDMLGSSVFRWWADTIIKVVKKGERDRKAQIELSFDLVRHAEDLIEPREVIFDREDLLFYSTNNRVIV